MRTRPAFLKPMGDVGQIALIDADIRDDGALDAVVAGAEIVVNAIGILFERGAQNFAALHARLPVRLAVTAQKAGVKQILHVSALGADLQSPSNYARTKAEGEAELRAAFPDAIVLRPALVFGPEDDFFNRFGALCALPAGAALDRRRRDAVPAGLCRRRRGCCGGRARSAPDAAGRVFELAGPEVFSFRELMELLLRETGRRRLLVSIPFGLASLEAWLLECLPQAAADARPGAAAAPRQCAVHRARPASPSWGITPTALELVLPSYLDRFRRRGRPWRGAPHIVTTSFRTTSSAPSETPLPPRSRRRPRAALRCGKRPKRAMIA